MPGEKTGLERAQSNFALINPVAVSEQLWNAYTGERLAVQNKFSAVLGSEKEDNEYGYYDETGDGALASAISKTVHKLEVELGLPEDGLLSGVYILKEDKSFEEEDQPRTVKLLTRVYSASSPTSVDIHLTYHSRSRYQSIEWYIGIGYKINTRLSPNKLPDSSDIFRQAGLRGNFSFDMYTRNGWNNFYKAFFDDSQVFSGRHWKRCEEKEVGLYEDGLKDVHDALLGPHPCMNDDTPRSANNEAIKRRRLVQTARLLLACVGIDCFIATIDSEEDALSSGEIRWCLEGIPSWLAREVRKAVGFQLERDAKEAREHAESVEEEKRGSYEEDLGSDEEYGF